MPEYPDIELYRDALTPRVVDQTITDVRLKSPFFLRSVHHPPAECVGQKIIAIHRLGKRVVFETDAALFIVIHLMVAGRFQWKEKPGADVPGRNGLAAFDFEKGTLLITEASKKKRASLHIEDAKSLDVHRREGLEIFDISLEEFSARLTLRNHTLKRALTDPRLFSGIGNGYSDEILHDAELSPIKMTQKLGPKDIQRLFLSTKKTLTHFKDLLKTQWGDDFPKKVTAFLPEMAVHGKFKEPCPRCSTAIQRIVYASNETNYCPRCQTEGKVLADRSLSRLLKKDWPRSIDELEKSAVMRGAKAASEK